MGAVGSQLVSISSLLFGMALLQMGSSLQGTLIGVRAIGEGFSANIIGIMSSGYFAGFILGTIATSYIIERAGHVRCFTALASLASAAVLGHIIIIDPIAWTIFRALIGLSFAGIYVTMESWLNERATNETRGQVLALYMVVNLSALTAGQWLLNFADPAGYVLFCAVSVLVSIALIPVALTRTVAPVPQKPRPLPLRRMFAISPLGVMASFAFGLGMGSFWGLAPVFADRVLGANEDIATFMSLCILGGGLVQWPLGWLSDRVDRRVLIIVISFLGAGACAAIAHLGVSQPELIFYFALVFGAATFPLYAISVSHTNDFVDAQERVLVSGTLLMVYGVGAVIGPLVAGLAMEELGPAGLFFYIGTVYGLVGIYGLWRMTRRAAVRTEEKAKFVPTTTNPQSTMQMDALVSDEAVSESEPGAVSESTSQDPSATEPKT